MAEIVCSCDEMRITPVEKEMADLYGLDPEYVHAFMDVWERTFDNMHP